MHLLQVEYQQDKVQNLQYPQDYTTIAHITFGSEVAGERLPKSNQ